MPLLTNDPWRRLLAESIDRAVARHHFRLIAFVFMPEHMHLLVSPVTAATEISALLAAIKRPFSYRIKQSLTANRSRLLERLTIRERPGVTCFRFRQEGSGYDRNMQGSTVLAATDYIHLNPVRRDLCETAIGWKSSSAHHYVQSLAVDPDLPTIHGLPPEFFDSLSTGSHTGGQAASGTLDNGLTRDHAQWHPATCPGQDACHPLRRRKEIHTGVLVDSHSVDFPSSILFAHQHMNGLPF